MAAWLIVVSVFLRDECDVLTYLSKYDIFVIQISMWRFLGIVLGRIEGREAFYIRNGLHEKRNTRGLSLL